MPTHKDVSFEENIEHNLITKYRKVLWRPFMKAIRDYELIRENDKIAVCISGGKDSMLLAKCMQELQKHGKQKIDLVFLVMNPGYSDKNLEKIKENASILGIPITIFDAPIFEAVNKDIPNPCYLCARMRRGYLYHKAKDLGCNKIALGHHFDDVIETILLSMFYGGEYKTMMPKLHSKNYEGMELIRPMYLIRESDIISFRDYHNLTFLNCACRFTEKIANHEENSKRYEIKKLLEELRKKNPLIDQNIFKSSENVNIEAILGIKKENTKENFLNYYNKFDE